MLPWGTRSHPFPLPWRNLVDSLRLADMFVLLLGDLSQHGNLLEQIGVCVVMENRCWQFVPECVPHISVGRP